MAVHVGAGFHAKEKERIYTAAIQRACVAAAAVLRRPAGGGGHAMARAGCLDAAVAAVAELERDGCTNCGLGSSLTEVPRGTPPFLPRPVHCLSLASHCLSTASKDGRVECDAGVMVDAWPSAPGHEHDAAPGARWAAVGAVTGVNEPISAAAQVGPQGKAGCFSLLFENSA